jgi:cyanophycin synthetase
LTRVSAFTIAAARVSARATRLARGLLPSHETTYVGERVEEYRQYWMQAADVAGARFAEIKRGVWEVSRGSCRTVIFNHITECDNPVALALASDKPFCYSRALDVGLPVPEHIVITPDSADAALAFQERLSASLVVKPAIGTSSGLGITTDVRTRRQLIGAIGLASILGCEIIVERMIAGESYRLLYLAGRLVHAVRRRGTRVVGDGRRSIAQLIRDSGHPRLVRDPVLQDTLAGQHKSLSDTPAQGESVLLLGVPVSLTGRKELRTVYNEVALGLCGQALIAECADLVRALGLEFAGVDVITTNPAVSLRESGGRFVEINTTPGLHHHYIGDNSPDAVPAAAQVVEYLLTRGGSSVIPRPASDGKG